MDKWGGPPLVLLPSGRGQHVKQKCIIYICDIYFLYTYIYIYIAEYSDPALE